MRSRTSISILNKTAAMSDPSRAKHTTTFPTTSDFVLNLFVLRIGNLIHHKDTSLLFLSCSNVSASIERQCTPCSKTVNST